MVLGNRDGLQRPTEWGGGSVAQDIKMFLKSEFIKTGMAAPSPQFLNTVWRDDHSSFIENRKMLIAWRILLKHWLQVDRISKFFQTDACLFAPT